MLASLRLQNFKNFADETLRMGPFTVLVGANASGKSNVRDALRFLHGVGRGYSLADIIGGRYGAGEHVEWAPIRGAVDEIVRFGTDEFAITVKTGVQPLEFEEYGIVVGGRDGESAAFHVVDEHLRARKGGVVGSWSPARTWEVFTSRPSASDPIWRAREDALMSLRMAKTGKQKKYGRRVRVQRDRPALIQIQEQKQVVREQKDRAAQVQGHLANMRFLDPSPDRMRRPSFPGQTVLGDRGDNLPTVLKEICADPKRRDTLVEWTRELTPMDVEDFEFPVDPITGRVQLAFSESSGRRTSAYAASDGTLRFLAMLAALLGPSPVGSLYVFEEIDNGIHPSRLRLLIDLIESRTAQVGVQVLTTTHSPEFVSMVSDFTFKHTSVVCRCSDTNDAVVRPVAELPDAERLRESQGLGRLHASGWMEDAVFFDGDGTDGS